MTYRYLEKIRVSNDSINWNERLFVQYAKNGIICVGERDEEKAVEEKRIYDALHWRYHKPMPVKLTVIGKTVTHAHSIGDRIWINKNFKPVEVQALNIEITITQKEIVTLYRCKEVPREGSSTFLVSHEENKLYKTRDEVLRKIIASIK